MNDRANELRVRVIRNFDSVEKQRERREPLYDTHCAHLAADTVASKLGISVDILAPGKASCPYHFHFAEEEAFVILEGSGTLRVAGERLAIVTGDTLFVPAGPEYPHQIINTSDRPLKYLSISTRASPEVVVYPDSNKYLVRVRGEPQGSNAAFAHIASLDEDLDYWAAEP